MNKSYLAVLIGAGLLAGCGAANDATRDDFADRGPIEFVPTAGTSLNCGDSIVSITVGLSQGECMVIPGSDDGIVPQQGVCWVDGADGSLSDVSSGSCVGSGKDSKGKCHDTKGEGDCTITPKPK